MRRLLCCSCVLVLALPAPALAARWAGTWENDASGTRGAARLTTARQAALLQLDGPALGCAERVTLAVRVRSGVVSGGGSDLPCNHGLHWVVAGPARAPQIHLRLADGSRAELRLTFRLLR